MRYRPDIDGLRAVAVIPVLLFHAQLFGVTGGYVGVDVFFVISGYLITGLISQQIGEGRFSYLTFWERRARRLLPALLLVTGITLVAAWFVLLPEEFKALGQSVVAISVFASNVYFWIKAGYFAAPSDMVPLLHTWSLAVEEQFYLLFPAVLLALTGTRPRSQRAVVAAIGLFSFAISVRLVGTDPDSAYYLLHARAWELMLGAYLALHGRSAPLAGRPADLALLAGIALIITPMLLYTEATPFPGWAGLPPCLGTALIIWVGCPAGSIVHRLYNNAPAIGIGKLSYSLYLWHWPALVLGSAYLGRDIARLSAIEVAGLLGIAWAGAWLSLRYVETPIRRGQVLGSRPGIFSAVAAGAAVLACAGFAVHFAAGLAWRVPQEIITLARVRGGSPCGGTMDKNEAVSLDTACRIGADPRGGREPTFLLWGDSHASALAAAVDRDAVDSGLAGYVLTSAGCPPIAGLDILSSRYAIGCPQHNQQVLAFIERHHIRQVVLAGYWGPHAFDNRTRLVDPRLRSASAGSLSNFQRAFSATIDRLLELGVTPIIVDEVPYPTDGFHPARNAIATWHGRDLHAGVSVEAYHRRTRWFETLVRRFEPDEVVRVHFDPYLCRRGFCPTVKGNRALFRDGHHLSAYGATLLDDAFSEAFDEAFDEASGTTGKSVGKPGSKGTNLSMRGG